MECLFIAGFETSARAAQATGRLTDEGAQREDLSLVMLSQEEGGGYTLRGEGVLAARLRLGGRDASLSEGLRWIGLDEDRIAVLEGLMESGGGLVVLAAPSAGLSLETARSRLLEQEPSAFTTVRILSAGTAEDPALRVQTSVGSEPATVLLHTLRERIAVEKRAVRRAADARDLEYLKDAVYDFRETAQVLEIRHVPYVVEEIVVNVERYLEEREIVEKIRQMKVEIEEL